MSWKIVVVLKEPALSQVDQAAEVVVILIESTRQTEMLTSSSQIFSRYCPPALEEILRY